MLYAKKKDIKMYIKKKAYRLSILNKKSKFIYKNNFSFAFGAKKTQYV